MSTYYFLVYFFLPVFAYSCSPYNFTCGNYTVPVEYPFSSVTDNHGCGGLHVIYCMNQEPLVQLHGQGFYYPMYDISYSSKTLIVHDSGISPYFRGSDCTFLYQFDSPIPRFNVSSFTENLTSSTPFFNCDPHAYNYSQDVFKQSYDLTSCRDYNLYYSSGLEDRRHLSDFPTYCSSTNGIWFDWKFSFDENGYFSLLSAGFSNDWTPFPGCFNCQIVGGSCSASGGGNSTCGCNNQCRGSYGRSIAGRSEARRIIIIGLCVGLASLLLISCVLIFRYCSHRRVSEILVQKNKKAKHARTIEAFLAKHDSLATKRYSYSHIRKMTKSFSEKLGQGGYGSVYKGKLSDGHPVAIKLLNETKGNGEDFINEVASIGNTCHINIVSLRGFCAEGAKRALIYDFMTNGSLDKYIYSEKLIAETFIGWEKLYEIAVGIARGLEYLHRGCNSQIVHFDIKPHNILLDQDFCPKISDFGMAKLCLPKQSIISMYGARGTIGYIAPEVFSRTFGVVSSKSDVYSYGMLVLDMFGGKQNMNTRLESASDTYFPQRMYKLIDNVEDLTRYGVVIEKEEIARKLLIVGMWCIQTMPENRPSMSRVIEMLEGSIQDVPIPPMPCLSSSPMNLIVDSCTSSCS